MNFKDNIGKYYIFQFLAGMNFTEAVFYLFLLSNGLNYTQAIFTQTWFTLVILFFQIFAGALADVWNRKKVLIFGTILMVAGSLYYATSYTFKGFLVAETLWGIGVACSYGTFISFVYESLIQLNKQKESSKIFSRGAFYLLLGGVFAPPVGSLFAGRFGLRSAMYLLILPQLASFFLMLLMSEPPKLEKTRFKSYFSQVWKSVKYVSKHETLGILIFMSTSMALLFWISFTLYQPHLKNVGIDVKWFGFIFAIANLLSAIMTRQAYLIEKRLGVYKTIIVTTLLPSSIFLVLSSSVSPLIVVLSITVLGVFRRFREPIFAHYYNKLVTSDKRATVIAFSDFTYWMSFTVLSPLVGYMADSFGIMFVFLVFAIAGFFVTGSVRLKINKLKSISDD